jgi:serine protease Do
MKFQLLPVVLTAALTSVATLFIAGRFQKSVPYFSEPTTHSQLPVSYVSGGSAHTAAPIDFEDAASSAVKAVVHIKNITKERTYVGYDVNDVFSQLFGPQQYTIPGHQESGSGVVVAPDGYIVTNNHVIANGDEVTVTFNDKFTKTAKVVAKDPSTDLALLKVDGENSLPYIAMGNSDDVRLGQWVLAVGYPLSLEATVTAGIVSAKGRSIGINKAHSQSAIESFIQTDAAVNPGNSGGALVNTAGELVGINSAIASPTGSYAGYSYAIPVNIVRKVVNDLMKFGSVQRAYMGIEYLDSKMATPQQIKDLGLDRKEGIYVMKVLPNSGAAQAGIKKGDLITQVNGQQVSTQPQLQEQIARYQPGDNITVAFVRDGKLMNTTVKLNKMETPIALLGASLRPLTEGEKSKLGIAGGVLVTEVGRGALGKQTQMHKGFVITDINDVPISSIADIKQILSGVRDAKIAGIQPGYAGRYYYIVTNIDVNKE